MNPFPVPGFDFNGHRQYTLTGGSYKICLWRETDMKKRIVAWIILLAVLFAAVPAWAVTIAQVEDFTVERDGGVITVTPPEGFAEKGYYKLFWKDEATGEIQSDVFPADTPSYRIEAEEDAEYSFQLYYAKQRGKLPSVWKEDRPEPTPSDRKSVV